MVANARTNGSTEVGHDDASSSATSEPTSERGIESLGTLPEPATAAVTTEELKVARVEGADVVLARAGGELRARRAVSCLVAPEIGDRVMVARAPSGAFVLAVLTRASSKGATTIVAEGDLELRAPNGEVRAAAQHGVRLVSGGEATITAAKFSVHAIDADVVVERLTAVADTVAAELKKVKVLASAIDRIVDRVSDRVKRSFRNVEEVDHVRSGQLDYVAKETVSIRGENAVVTAQELVKVDGEQIHVG